MFLSLFFTFFLLMCSLIVVSAASFTHQRHGNFETLDALCNQKHDPEDPDNPTCCFLFAFLACSAATAVGRSSSSSTASSSSSSSTVVAVARAAACRGSG